MTTRDVQWKPQKNMIPPYKCLGTYVHINCSSRTSLGVLGSTLFDKCARLIAKCYRLTVSSRGKISLGCYQNSGPELKNCTSIRESIYSSELSQAFLLAGILFRLSSAVSCVSGVNLEKIYPIYVVRALSVMFPPFQTWELTIVSVESLTKDLLPSLSQVRDFSAAQKVKCRSVCQHGVYQYVKYMPCAASSSARWRCGTI